MMKFIIYFILICVVILFAIGLRGVSVDSNLSEFEKNKFLLKYGIIILISITSMIVFYFYTKK